jgi:two-component system, NtrC family, response regulator HydG
MMNRPSDTTAPILLVDDEAQILFVSSLLLRGEGFRTVHTLDDSRNVLPFLAKHDVGLIVLDLYMPHLSGSELLGEIVYNYPQTPVIVMTAVNELNTAVECMKKGAFDYLVKPVEKDRFVYSIKRGLEVRGLNHEVSSLKQYLLTDQLRYGDAFSPIVTSSKKMRGVFQYTEAIAATEQPVLITGETGVGKELIAKAVHDSSRRQGAFVPVNLAGLDDNMFSDTLFGHKKGAYTGAERHRDGLINQAADGTLFLDEIGDINEASQVKLLRLLQEQQYYPLGSDIPSKSKARIVVATNRDLEKRIGDGAFRNDLYYRLRTHQVYIPPLRERSEDIPLLFNHFLAKASEELGKESPPYPAELMSLLSSYNFPGNVRELQTMVFDALARHRRGMLSMDSFRKRIAHGPLTPTEAGALLSGHAGSAILAGITDGFPTLGEAEEYLISEALRLSGNKQGTAASMLGITRQALNKRLIRKGGGK